MLEQPAVITDARSMFSVGMVVIATGAPGAAAPAPAPAPSGLTSGATAGATAARGASQAQAELVPRVMADDLVIEGFDGDAAGRAPTPAAVAAASAHAIAMGNKPKTVRIRRLSGKPFSNYQKYEAKTKALEGHTIHVTSVGPYVSKAEQKVLDEQDARAKSIHKHVFKPGGLWDKYEPPPGASKPS